MKTSHSEPVLTRLAIDDSRFKPVDLDWHAPNIEAWDAAHQRFGIVQLLIVNQQTGHILNPPGLYESLLHSRQTEDVPALLLDVSPEDESLVCLVLAGGVDRALLPRLRDDAVLDILMAAAERNLDDVRALGLTVAELLEIFDTVADTGALPEELATPLPVGGADTWGIPMLDPTLQAEELGAPVKWGTFRRGAAVPGALLHFYTDDSKFSALVKDPLPVVLAQPAAIVEPNFSTNAHMPGALVLHGIYQKRTLAAGWQTRGIRVLVDLNVDRRWFELALLGVPAGWRAYANRARTSELEHLVEAHALACERRGGEDVLYVVYGGGMKARAFCEPRGWVWLPEDSDRKRGRVDGER